MTSLSIEFPVSADTLHLLPGSVSNLSINLLTIGRDFPEKSFARFFFPPSSVAEEPLFTSFVLQKRYRWSKSASASSSAKDQFWLAPAPEYSRPPVVTLGHQTVLDVLPTTLTSLDILYGAVLNPIFFNSLMFPNLLHLAFRQEMDYPLGRLGEFTSLTSLELMSIRPNTIGFYPPNLTRLIIHSNTELLVAPSSIPQMSPEEESVFLAKNCCGIYSNFPVSLTKLVLHSNRHGELEALVAPLIHLRTFSISENYVMRSLPLSLTKLKVWKIGDSDDSTLDTVSIFRRLPSLKSLYSRAEYWDLKSIMHVESRLPPGFVIRAGGLWIDELALSLPSQAGYGPESLSHIPTSLVDFLMHCFRKAYPHWKLERQRRRSDWTPLSSSIWSDFCSILSPNLHTLDVSSYFALPSSHASCLPRNLKVLRIGRFVGDPYHSTRGLPPSLTELEIHALGFGKETYASIPPSVTRLILNEQKKFPRSYALILPPSLTDLTISTYTTPLKTLAALPSSITQLKFDRQRINLQHLESLPSSIKSILGSLNSVNVQDLLAIIKRNGLIWLEDASDAALCALDPIDDYLTPRV